MKIKIKKEILLENLNKVSKAISTKNLVPALAGIKFDLNNENKIILGEKKEFKKQMKILECSDITYIQTCITFIARRNHHYGYWSYDEMDALTFIKGIERLREIVDSY